MTTTDLIRPPQDPRAAPSASERLREILPLVLIAATVLVTVAGAILASPYLLVRRLRRRRQAHADVGVPAPQLIPFGSRRAAA